MAARSLRIAFFGTPDVAVPSLEALLSGPHEVAVVVSQPDRGRGRGRKHSASPVSELAQERGIPLLRPEKIAEPEAVEALAAFEPDVGVVVAFGQFLPKRVRELPSEGYLINAHASLLPRYRGAAPIARAILDGEAKTGVSIMRIEREMDAGPVALTRSLEIGELENTRELTARLSILAADALVEALDRIARGSATWTEQDHARASAAPKIEKAETALDWQQSSAVLVRRVHGLAPKPGAFTTLPGRSGQTAAGETLRILRARPEPYTSTAGASDEAMAPAGTVRLGAGHEDPALRIATGSGWLIPLEVQRAGGRPMKIADFLRGFEIAEGTRLGAGDANSHG